MITIGSLFSGIGGFELGLERAIPNSKTIWQVEQNKYCHTILSKHWPGAKIYDDVRDITKDNVSPVDILCGGFPCQDISIAGKKGGIHAEKSGLWWEMLRIIGELRPRIAVLENVPNIIRLGGLDVLGSLASIGYNAEWTIISARMFGAPHLRKRWFCVCYPADTDTDSEFGQSDNDSSLEGTSADSISFGCRQTIDRRIAQIDRQRREIFERRSPIQESTNSTSTQRERDRLPGRLSKKQSDSDRSLHRTGYRYWEKTEAVSPLCDVDDGIPHRLARLRALGNAIVPQCSEWIGEQIVKSGLLEDV